MTEIIIYDKNKKRCNHEFSHYIPEKGVFIQGLKIDTLMALLENTTFICTTCQKKVYIVDELGDVVMLVRHHQCAACYQAENEDL